MAPRPSSSATSTATGFADVVACAEITGVVGATFQIGGGAFAHGTIASGLDSPYTLALGDLDGDGDTDVLIGQYDNLPLGGTPEEAELLWARNPVIGGGGWTTFAVSYLASVGIRQAVLADFDRDGDLDIAAATVEIGGNADSFFWLANDGTPADGGWSLRSVSVMGEVGEPYALAPADVDQDGDLDLVAADRSQDDVRWYENDGVPNDYWTVHPVDSALGGAASVAAGDLDGDGELEIVAAGHDDDRISWYEPSGATWTEHVALTPIDGPGGVRLIDFDFDGDLDIVAAVVTADQVLWLENQGGAAPLFTSHVVQSGFTEPLEAAAADLDGDGDLDLVAAAWADDRVAWWENELTHREFKAAEPIDVRTAVGNPQAVELSDVNRDGVLDTVAALRDGDTIAVYLGLGSGTLWLTNTVVTGFDGARDVAVGDLDRDGTLDVVGVAIGGDDLRWWSNDGSVVPDWTEHVISGSYNGAHRVEVLDYDLDGDLDLVTAAYDGNRVDLWENTDGQGAAWDQHLLASLSGAFDLVVADFNGDRKPDVAATGAVADAVHVYLNSVGIAGIWGDVTVKSSASAPRGLDAADFDGDGDVDLAFVQRDNDLVLWYDNHGDGTVWSGHTVGTGTLNDGAAVRAADLDDDGDADVVATSQADGDVIVWSNGGDGTTWVRYLMEQSLDSPWDVFSGDIDGDGRLDLAVAAGGTADRLVWYPDIGAQASTLVSSWAPGTLANGASAVVFHVIVDHQGRTGWDANGELAGMRLDFADTVGNPLSSAQANAIVASIKVWQDTDRDLTLTGADLLVETVTTLSLSGGRLELGISDGEPAASIAPGTAWSYFVEFQTTANASLQTPNQIRVTLPGDDQAGIHEEDRDHDLALSIEPHLAVTTRAIALGSWAASCSRTASSAAPPERGPTPGPDRDRKKAGTARAPSFPPGGRPKAAGRRSGGRFQDAGGGSGFGREPVEARSRLNRAGRSPAPPPRGSRTSARAPSSACGRGRAAGPRPGDAT